jgi:ubiquinone/menaquinone biosynthesis C-methylase UbiE
MQEYNLDMFGVEPSKIMRERCKLRHNNLNISKGDANHIPFSDNFFDGALIECVFSLIEDKKAALIEIKRILKPNARLIISDVYMREKSQINKPALAADVLAAQC